MVRQTGSRHIHHTQSRHCRPRRSRHTLLPELAFGDLWRVVENPLAHHHYYPIAGLKVGSWKLGERTMVFLMNGSDPKDHPLNAAREAMSFHWNSRGEPLAVRPGAMRVSEAKAEPADWNQTPLGHQQCRNTKGIESSCRQRCPELSESCCIERR